MKIIHTADWHLGKILNGKSLLEDQIYILKQFIDQMLIENQILSLLQVIYMIHLIQVKMP